MNKRSKHFMRGLSVVAGGLIAAVFLAGCSQQSQKNESSRSKASTHVTTTKKAKTSHLSQSQSRSQSQSQVTPKAQTLWNATKDQQLKAFIDQWAPTMGQAYTKYDGHTPLTVSTGTVYPDVLQKITVHGTPGTIGWQPQGTGHYNYNVVAIYNYDGTQPPLPNHITYVFAFHDQHPVVLVDQTRDGDPTLTPTQNADVRSAFSKIAGGASATQTKASTSATDQNEALDAKTVGVLIKESLGDDVTKEPTLHFATNTAKYPYLIDTGTATSQVPYRFTNTEVTYGLRDPNAPTSANVFIDHTVSLRSLRAKYYHSPAQNSAIKQTVARLQD